MTSAYAEILVQNE